MSDLHRRSPSDNLLRRVQLQIERMPLAYVQFDADFRIVDWNHAAERIFGYDKAEILGTGPPFEKILPPKAREQTDDILSRIRRGDMSAHSVNENLTKDGRTIICEWFNTPLVTEEGEFDGLLCLAQDVTERKSLEEQLRHAQKMEAVGQLAGGVAHDFNNLLTVIICYGELLLESIQPDDPGRVFLQEIRKAAERSAALTRQLLSFSRKQIQDLKVLDLNEIVHETENMLNRIIGEDVELLAELEAPLDRIKVDAGQLDQVILNLVVNARDAMPAGGQLTIETRNVELDEAYAKAHPGVLPGHYVLLAVTDTGTGMSDEIKQRLFEPFFTTKAPGRGTGLGLPVVHGIVKQSGGHIEVESEPKRGSTFKIYFPRFIATGSSSNLQRGDSNAPRGTETILLVEDEAIVRALSRRVLQGCGYTVLEAGTGDEALRLFREHSGPIHLLLTDVVMPGTGGRDLAEVLAPLHPGIKVLYVSGYTDDAVLRHGVSREQINFLQKPFTPVTLATKIREVLEN